MSKVALVLGGTYDHIHLLKLLKIKGYYTVLVDYYENPPAKLFADRHIKESTLDLDLVLSIAYDIKPSLVIATCIDQALLTMAYVSEKLKLPCHISYQTALELTNKAYMKKNFMDNGIPTVNYEVLENGIMTPSKDHNFPLVVKPADANSSKGIKKVKDKSSLMLAIQEAYENSQSSKVIVEEFFDGEEYSVDVVVSGYEPEIIMMSKNIKESGNTGKFTIIQSYYSDVYRSDDKLVANMKSVIAKIAKAYRIKNGPLLVQLLRKGDQLSVIEFSSRIGGGSKHELIKKITNIDMIEYFIELLEGNVRICEPDKCYKYGLINYIYTKSDKIVKYSNFNEIEQSKLVDKVFYYKTEGTTVLGDSYSSDRSVGLMIADNNEENLFKRLAEANKKIKILNKSNKNIITEKFA